LDVPGSLDVDDAIGQVYVVPTKRLELAAAEAAVERRRPEGPITFGNGGE
jgi:hypothetical protein